MSSGGWVAVSVNLDDDPKVAAFAKALHVRKDSAIARLVRLWGQVSIHLPETGNLGEIDGRSLEEWANWKGIRGAFDREFRPRFQDPDGTLHGWAKWNGRHLIRARIERERKAEVARKARGKEEQLSALQPALRGAEILGDRTVPNLTTKKRVPKKTSDLSNGIPKEPLPNWVAAVREGLAEGVGVYEFGRIGKDLKSAAGVYDHTLLGKAAQAYAKWTRGLPPAKAQFCSLKDFTERVGYWVDFVTPGRALELVDAP